MRNNNTLSGADQRIANPLVQIGDVIFGSFNVNTPVEAAGPSVRDCAIDLARRGFYVFRISPRGNTPAAEGWQWEATNDPEKVRDLWTGRPGNELRYNIGIATGRKLPNGKYLGVLDIDVKDGKQGAESLAMLDAVHEDRQDTLASQTSSGGQHHFFSSDEPLRNSVEAIAKGIDVRGVGGYVVAPGSIRNGATYSIVRDVPIAAAPAFMVAAQSKAKPKVEVIADVELDTPQAIDRAKDYVERRAPEAIEGAGGNDQTYKVTCAVREYGLSYEVAIEIMRDYNDAKCFPPWNDDDLERIARSAYKHAQNSIVAKSVGNEFEAVEIGDVLKGDAILESKNSIDNPPTAKRKGLLAVDWEQNSFDTEQPYLIDGVLGLGTLVVTYGDSNTGKTFVKLDQCFHIAAGRDWNGHKVKQGLVVYVAAEGGSGFFKRIAAYQKKYGVSRLPFTTLACPIDLQSERADTKRLIDIVKEAEARHGEKCVLLVIDTLARAMAGGDENTAVDIGKFVIHRDRIREAVGATVDIVHHTGKDKAKGARGSSALRAATDTEIEIDVGSLRITKQRDMERAPDMRFELEAVEIGHRSDGKPVTACVVNWIGSAASEFAPTLTPPQKLALDAFDRLLSARTVTGDTSKSVSNGDWAKAIEASKEGPKGKQLISRVGPVLIQAGLLVKTSSNQYVRIGHE